VGGGGGWGGWTPEGEGPGGGEKSEGQLSLPPLAIGWSQGKEKGGESGLGGRFPSFLQFRQKLGKRLQGLQTKRDGGKE